MKKVDQGGVSEVGERAENEELVPKRGAVGSLEVFRLPKKSDTDQTCIFCECCRVAPPVVATGGAIRNLMLQPDRNPQLVAEAAVVLTSLLRKSKPRCSFLETAGCRAVICKQVISQTTTPASYSFVGK